MTLQLLTSCQHPKYVTYLQPAVATLLVYVIECYEGSLDDGSVTERMYMCACE